MSEYPLHIDVRSVKDLLDDQADMLLIDCREPDEHQRVCIPEAKLIPMGQVSEQLSVFEPYRERRIVVHCHHGGRSMKVVQWLRGQGFQGAQNMTGGIDTWALLIDTSLPRY